MTLRKSLRVGEKQVGPTGALARASKRADTGGGDEDRCSRRGQRFLGDFLPPTDRNSPRRSIEQRQEDGEGDHGGADLDRLGCRVRRAADASRRVGEHRRAEAGEHRRLAAAPAAADAVEQEDESEGRSEVIADRGHRAVARRQAEVAGGPDAERLEGRDLAEEVAEAGAVGVEGLEAVEVQHAADLGGDEDGEGEGRQQDGASGRGTGSADGEFQQCPETRGADQPDQAGEAVDVDGADGEEGCGDEAQGEVAPGAGRLAQGEDEGEDEQGLDRLLEGALGEVGGDDVGEADDQGAGGARDGPQAGEGGERGQRCEHGDSDTEAAEALDEADAQSLVQSDDDRVRPERVALVQQLSALAVGEPVGSQQVLGHVRVEAGAEDPEVAFDRERQRGRQQRDQGDRPARPQRLPQALHPSPEIDDGRHHEDRHDDRRDDPVAPKSHRPPADRAEQRQANRWREPRPAAGRRTERPPPGQSPAKLRTPPTPLRKSRSQGPRA